MKGKAIIFLETADVSEPGKTECRESCYGQGSSCKKCDIPKCYRKGWDKWQVDADNKKRCATKNGRPG